MKPKPAYHRNLGLVTITDECQQMERGNHNPTTRFVEHDGEIIQVTASLVTTRAHTILFQRRFVDLIETHEKTHTIRPDRRRQIHVGDGLRLRHWEAAPYRSPQVEFMIAICRKIEAVTIYPNSAFHPTGQRLGRMTAPADLNRFARRDGFTDWEAMREWFHINHGVTANNPFRGIVIHWAD